MIADRYRLVKTVAIRNHRLGQFAAGQHPCFVVGGAAAGNSARWKLAIHP
jgi:hypothetical protein